MPHFLLYAFALAAIVKAISLAISYFHHFFISRKLQCAAAPLFPNSGLFGINNLRTALKADREKLLPELYEKRVITVSSREGRLVSTFRIQQMGRENVFTSDPKNIQALLATQFDDFALGQVRIGSFRPLLGTGIFAADGKTWEHSRTLLRPQFTRDQVGDIDLEERHVQNAMLALPAAADCWTAEIDIQTLFFRLTIDSATEFLFGKSVDSQLAAIPNGPFSQHHEDGFAYAFDKSQWYLAQRTRFENFYWLIDNFEFRRNCKQVHDYVDHFVHLALAKQQQPPEIKENEKPSSARYIFLDALASKTQDPIELRSQLLNILLAGRDTTASLLSWTFLLLAEHQNVFMKLRAAIINDFGPYQRPREITFARLKSCQYLQYCLNEVLRLYPVVPVNRRSATRDTSLPQGGGPEGISPIYIRKGQSVVYSVHVLHRRKDIWGEDADSFVPERWNSRRATWEYIPFNGGPRICIGQQFAMTEAAYVIVRFLQRFDRMKGLGEQKPRYGLTLTSCPAESVKVKLHVAPS